MFKFVLTMKKKEGSIGDNNEKKNKGATGKREHPKMRLGRKQGQACKISDLLFSRSGFQIYRFGISKLFL